MSPALQADSLPSEPLKKSYSTEQMAVLSVYLLGEGNGNPLNYSCLDNPMDRRAWWAKIHGVTRLGHDLVTKPPPPPFILNTICLIRTLSFKQRYLGHKSIHIY